jgi:hypothetical protein
MYVFGHIGATTAPKVCPSGQIWNEWNGECVSASQLDRPAPQSSDSNTGVLIVGGILLLGIVGLSQL